MPVCPRCGKCLSSEQALTYHLNRKYKCGTWNCVQCGMNHNTKFQLQIHEMQCFENRDKNELPTTELLLAVYNQMPLICSCSTINIASIRCRRNARRSSAYHKRPFWDERTRSVCNSSTHTTRPCTGIVLYYLQVFLKNAFKNKNAL